MPPSAQPQQEQNAKGINYHSLFNDTQKQKLIRLLHENAIDFVSFSFRLGNIHDINIRNFLTSQDLKTALRHNKSLKKLLISNITLDSLHAYKCFVNLLEEAGSKIQNLSLTSISFDNHLIDASLYKVIKNMNLEVLKIADCKLSFFNTNCKESLNFLQGIREVILLENSNLSKVLLHALTQALLDPRLKKLHLCGSFLTESEEHKSHLENPELEQFVKFRPLQEISQEFFENIAKNKTLKELFLGGETLYSISDNVKYFASAIARNRSLKSRIENFPNAKDVKSFKDFKLCNPCLAPTYLNIKSAITYIIIPIIPFESETAQKMNYDYKVYNISPILDVLKSHPSIKQVYFAENLSFIERTRHADPSQECTLREIYQKIIEILQHNSSIKLINTRSIPRIRKFFRESDDFITLYNQNPQIIESLPGITLEHPLPQPSLPQEQEEPSYRPTTLQNQDSTESAARRVLDDDFNQQQNP